MAEHPTHPRHLQGTKWTSASGLHHFRHWEVVKLVRDEAHLQATLDSKTLVVVPWRSLRIRTEWEPGWLSTATSSSEAP